MLGHHGISVAPVSALERRGGAEPGALDYTARDVHLHWSIDRTAHHFVMRDERIHYSV